MKISERLDSWANLITGLGSSLRDKRRAWVTETPDTLVYAQLEDLVRSDGLARKIAFKIPETAFRQGIDVTVTDDPDRGDQVAEAIKDLRGLAKCEEAAAWARTFGGAVVVLGADDGLAPDQPLNFDSIRSVDFLDVLDRSEIEPVMNASSMRRIESAELFRFVDSTGQRRPLDMIHRSRLLFFPGALTTRRQRQRQSGWDDSVLQAVYDALVDFQNNWQSAAYLMSDASQAVFKIKGLMQMLGAQQRGKISERIALVDYSRSVARAIALDADGESFERTSTSFAGLPDMLDRTMQRVAAEADMPVALLFGQSAAGMDATGEMDVRAWYDSVASWQERVARAPLEYLVKVFLSVGQAAPEEWSLDFPPLWAPTQAQVVAERKTQAETDAIYLDHGVLDPETVTRSRFTASGWSAETVIEDTGKAEMDDLDAEGELAETEPAEVKVSDPGTAEPKPQAAALNGAQVTALAALATQVATAEIPAETAIQIVLVSFPLDEAQAKAIFDPITPKEPPLAANPFGNAGPGDPSKAPPPPPPKQGGPESGGPPGTVRDPEPAR